MKNVKSRTEYPITVSASDINIWYWVWVWYVTETENSQWIASDYAIMEWTLCNIWMSDVDWTGLTLHKGDMSHARVEVVFIKCFSTNITIKYYCKPLKFVFQFVLFDDKRFPFQGRYKKKLIRNTTRTWLTKF